jgi:(p)ppGpp synthase/HD superfamily hydrolase
MQSIFNPKVERARMFAHTSHGSQKYGGEFAYIMHLQAVVSVLIRYGIDNVDMLCAGWLHDVLEDAYDDVEEGSKIIESLFGREVLEIVQAVTEPKGGNRKWRHEQTYPRICERCSVLLS